MDIKEVIDKITNDDFEVTESVDATPDAEASHVAQLELDLQAAQSRIAELEEALKTAVEDYKAKVLALLGTMTAEDVEETKKEIENETESEAEGIDISEAFEMLKGD